MNTLHKIWNFIVRYWKFFVGFFLALGGFVVFSRVIEKPPDTSKIDLDVEENSNKLLRAVISANTLRDKRLVNLAKDHKEKLSNLSEKQQEEFSQLVDKPVEEIVAWFDKL